MTSGLRRHGPFSIVKATSVPVIKNAGRRVRPTTRGAVGRAAKLQDYLG
jgi:hypothetical protein